MGKLIFLGWILGISYFSTQAQVAPDAETKNAKQDQITRLEIRYQQKMEASKLQATENLASLQKTANAKTNALKLAGEKAIISLQMAAEEEITLLQAIKIDKTNTEKKLDQQIQEVEQKYSTKIIDMVRCYGEDISASENSYRLKITTIERKLENDLANIENEFIHKKRALLIEN